MNDFRQLFVDLIFACMCARVQFSVMICYMLDDRTYVNIYRVFMTYIRGYATLLNNNNN